MRARKAALSCVLSAALVGTVLVPAQTAEASTYLTRDEVLALAQEMAAQATGDGAPAPDSQDTDPNPAATTGDPGTSDATQPAAVNQLSVPTTEDPIADPDGTISAGTATTVTAVDLGIGVTFSGHEVESDLDVRIDDLTEPGAAVPGAMVARSATTTAGRTSGLPADSIVLVEPFEVVARDAEGHEVTSFPTRSVQVERDGDDVPVTDTDIVPGVVLDVPVEVSRTEGIDTGTVRLYTRETDADQWHEVASYLDAETGRVYGELDHLSQFVVIGTAQDPDPTPRIVLDPDNDIANTVSPAGKVTELPFNIQLASSTALLFGERCRADVMITRVDAGQTTLSQTVRAGMAAAWDPDLTVTLAFDAVKGHPWGTESNGGSKVYPGDGPHGLAAADSLNTQLPGYTGRPSELIGSTLLPYDDLRSLPGALVHLEALNLDHNYDWPVIEHGMQYIANGVFTGLGMYLESQGFNCNDPSLGGWPSRPSQEELDRWRQLGYQNYQTYGADPVSFSTGNLIEDEDLFSLSGPGGTSLDLTLVYNSQDGRLSRTGAGWSFDYGARAQRFEDGGVMVVRGDGASFMYEPDGAGGFTTDPGNSSTLHDLGDGRLEQVDVDGTRRVFDTSDLEGIGELTSITDQLGHATSLTYGEPDEDDQFVPLTSITDSAGQTVTVHPDGLGRVAGFTLPDGRTWSLSYDDAGNLTQITNPDGRTRTFGYDDAHRMTSATDPLGVTYLRNTFDEQGRVAEQWDADGNRRTWTFTDTPDDRGLRAVVYRDNEGRDSTYRFDAKYRIVEVIDTAGRTQTYTFDDADRITRHRDADGRVTGYAYDPSGNVSRETAADGSVQSWTYDAHGAITSQTDALDRTTAWGLSDRGLAESIVWADGTTATAGYDAAGNLTSVTDEAGQTTRYEYDSRSNQVAEVDPTGARSTFEYDQSNRMTASIDANGARTEYRWDAGDRMIERVDPLGGVTRVSYDGNDHPVSMTDATGATTTMTWDDLFRITSVTDATGATTRYSYTTEDELVQVTDPTGGVVRYTLDDADRIIEVTDPNGGIWSQTYDAAGNIASRTTPEEHTTEYTYDELGRQLSETDPMGGTWATAYDTVGRVVAEVDPTGATTAYDYDSNDQIVRVTDAAGNATEYTYDAVGNRTSTTDRRGNVWTSEYDAVGRLTALTDPLDATTAYSYDPVGNLTSVTDALSAVTSYAYDLNGQLTSETDPLGAVRSTEYDAAGRQTATTDALGARTEYGFDAVGRLTSTLDALGARTEYAYDAVGRQTSTTDPRGTVTAYGYDPAGQLTSVVEATEGTTISGTGPVTTGYAYDGDGNLVSILNGRDFATTLEYDDAGRVTSESDPTGRTWTYRYDLAGRLTSQTDASGRISTYAYDEVGNLTRQAFLSGQTVDYEYDAEQQLIAMDDDQGTTAWGYDAAGRMTQQVDTFGKTLDYSYDLLGQVVALELPGGDTVASTFDAAGRMTQQSTPWGDLAYAWDAEHRLTSTARTEADGTEGITSTVAYDQVGRVLTVAHLTPELATDGTSQSVASDGAPSTAGVLPWRSPTTTAGAAPEAAGQAATCTSTSAYLDGRSIPESGTSPRCQAATDYLADREVPDPTPVARDGDGLRFDYTYDPAGNVDSRTRTVGWVDPAEVALDSPDGPGTVEQTDFSYDALSRLVTSQSTPGTEQTYTYDETNNLTGWTSTGQDQDVSWASHFDGGNRLTSAAVTDGDKSAEVRYSLDGNGARTSASVSGDSTLVSGLSMSASYGDDGKLSSYTANGATTSYTYDGLGRAITRATTEHSGTVETAWIYDGLTPVAGATDSGADVALIRDSLGHVVLQSDEQLATTTDGTDRWALVDAIGSVVAEASAASGASSITQLSSYDDYGSADQATPGWGSALGYSGELADLSTGTVSYFQRLYDPLTGSWPSQDAWRGLLERPGTLNGFAFVFGNPTSMVDLLGFAGMLIDGEWGSQGAYRAGQKAREKVKQVASINNARKKSAEEQKCILNPVGVMGRCDGGTNDLQDPHRDAPKLHDPNKGGRHEEAAFSLSLQGCAALVCAEIALTWDVDGDGLLITPAWGPGVGIGFSGGVNAATDAEPGPFQAVDCFVAAGMGASGELIDTGNDLDGSFGLTPGTGAGCWYKMGSSYVLWKP